MLQRLLLSSVLAGGLALSSQEAFAQATPIGAVVEADGNCPTTSPLTPGVGRPLFATNNGQLCTSGGGGGGSGGYGTIGSAVPSTGVYNAFDNPSGNLTGVSASNPLPTAAQSVVSAPTVTPTISTSAYTAGYVFAPIMSFTVTTSGIIGNSSVTLNTGSYTGGINLYIFSQNPSNGTYNANSAWALNSTDAGYLQGVLNLSNCAATGTTSTQCQTSSQSLVYKLASGTTLYAIPVILAAGTFTNATDAKFVLTGIQ